LLRLPIGTTVALFQLGNPGAEFVFLEQIQQLVVVLLPIGQVFQTELQFHIGTDGRQLPTQGQDIFGLAQVLTDLAFDLVGVFDQVVQIFVGLQPFNRCFRAAFVHAGDVVDLVPDQGQVIHNLVGRDAKFIHYAVTIHGGFGHGVDQGNVVADQLSHVLVTGGDHHIDAFAGGLVGQGANHIIGFHTRHDQQRQAHGLDDLVDGLNLYRQVVRHGWAVGLVLFVHVVTKGFALGVKHHHNFGAGEILLQPAQHADHPFDGPGGVVLAGGQRRQCVIGAEQVGRSVHQNHGWGLFITHVETGPDSD